MNSWLEEALNIDPGFARGLQFVIALLIVLGLIAIFVWILRRISGVRVGRGPRNRQPRIAVMDATTLDARRRLILVRRDNIEHLLLIGGPSDVVVERNIIRGQPVAGYARQAVQQPQHTQQSMAQAGMQGSGAPAAPPMPPTQRAPQPAPPAQRQPPATPVAPTPTAAQAPPPRASLGGAAQPASAAATQSRAIPGVAMAGAAIAGAATAVARAKDAVGKIGTDTPAASPGAQSPERSTPAVSIESAAPKNDSKTTTATPIPVTSSAKYAGAHSTAAGSTGALKPTAPQAAAAGEVVSAPTPISAPAQASSAPFVQAPKADSSTASSPPVTVTITPPQPVKPQPAESGKPAVEAPLTGRQSDSPTSSTANGDKPADNKLTGAITPVSAGNGPKAENAPETDKAAATHNGETGASAERSRPSVDLAAHLEEALLGPTAPPAQQSKPDTLPEAPKTPAPSKAAPTAVPDAPEPHDALKADKGDKGEPNTEDKKASSDKQNNGGPAAMDDTVTIDTIEEEMAKLLNEIGGKDKK